MSSAKEIRDELLRVGALARLKALNKERAYLLKLAGLPLSTNGDTHRSILKTTRSMKKAAKAKKPAAAKKQRRKGWTPERLAKYRATMQKKYGKTEQWPAMKAIRKLQRASA